MLEIRKCVWIKDYKQTLLCSHKFVRFMLFYCYTLLSILTKWSTVRLAGVWSGVEWRASSCRKFVERSPGTCLLKMTRRRSLVDIKMGLDWWDMNRYRRDSDQKQCFCSSGWALPTVSVEIPILSEQFPVRISQGKYLFLLSLLELRYRTVVLQYTAAGWNRRAASHISPIWVAAISIVISSPARCSSSTDLTVFQTKWLSLLASRDQTSTVTGVAGKSLEWKSRYSR